MHQNQIQQYFIAQIPLTRPAHQFLPRMMQGESKITPINNRLKPQRLVDGNAHQRKQFANANAIVLPEGQPFELAMSMSRKMSTTRLVFSPKR